MAAYQVHWFGFISGAAGGAAIGLEVSSRRLELAMYIFLYATSSAYQCLGLPRVKNGDSLLFALSTAVLMYGYKFAPQSLRPSYVSMFKFLMGETTAKLSVDKPVHSPAMGTGALEADSSSDNED